MVSTMFNRQDKVRVTDEEAEEHIRAKTLKPLYTIEDGVTTSSLSKEDREILYGEALWHEKNNPKPYKMIVLDSPEPK